MTCKARLKVRDAAAIGAILACPKCGGMVLVTAPQGWKPPEPFPPDGAARPNGAGQSGGAGQPQVPAESDPIKAASDRTAVRGGSSIELPAMTTTRAAGTAAQGDKKSPRWQDEVTVAAGVATGAVERGGPQSNLGEAGNVPGASAKAAWIKWSTFVGAPLAGLGLIVGGWLFSSSRNEPELTIAPIADVPQPELREPQEPAPPPADAPAPPAPLDRRWLPSAAEGVLSFRPRDLEQQPAARTVLGHTATLWNPALATFFASFPLTPADIRRLTWAATDLAAADGDDWLLAGVVIVELERPVAERKEWLDGCAAFDEKLGFDGELGFDGKLGESILRTVSQGDWPNPFAVVDDRTIVTGPAAALEAIADRGGPRAAQTELDRLVDRLDVAPELIWALDLAAVRARDAMPAWLPLVEVWHADHDDWHVVRELPLAVGLGLRIGERFEMELLLACDGESSAEQVEQALGRVLTAVEQTLAGEAEGLTKKLLAGEITTADAGQLKLLFSAS
ncbi:MAG TPA: hypothetical protein VGX78_04970, partial [Pirellulales bacterium]|nr:hypothetical protein [Pirellulales bacterium]